MSYYEDRIKALEARIEEMAMLNRMKAVPVEAKLMDRIGELNAENARLKTEVERLTAFTTRTIIPNKELQAQVERLTKAGDAMLKAIKVTDPILDWKIELWNAAKEGKQS
jgi:phage host-nuclease inhibitor protein Gam